MVAAALLVAVLDLSLLTCSPHVRLGSLPCPPPLPLSPHCPVVPHILPSFPQVEALLDEGVYDMRVYKERGFVTDLLYECELEELLKQRTETEEGKELRKVRGGLGMAGAGGVASFDAGQHSGVGGVRDRMGWHGCRQGASCSSSRPGPSSHLQLQVGYRKYSRVSPTAFGLSGGRKAIAVVRTAGAITGTSSGGASGGSSITSPAVIGQLRALKKDKVSRQWGWVWVGLQSGSIAMCQRLPSALQVQM